MLAVELNFDANFYILVIKMQYFHQIPLHCKGLNTLSECVCVCDTMWNALPDNVRKAPSLATFRKRLTTHLFDLAFPP